MSCSKGVTREAHPTSLIPHTRLTPCNSTVNPLLPYRPTRHWHAMAVALLAGVQITIQGPDTLHNLLVNT